jgi:hypothetical protein
MEGGRAGRQVNCWRAEFVPLQTSPSTTRAPPLLPAGSRISRKHRHSPPARQAGEQAHLSRRCVCVDVEPLPPAIRGHRGNYWDVAARHQRLQRSTRSSSHAGGFRGGGEGAGRSQPASQPASPPASQPAS